MKTLASIVRAKSILVGNMEFLEALALSHSGSHIPWRYIQTIVKTRSSRKIHWKKSRPCFKYWQLIIVWVTCQNEAMSSRFPNNNNIKWRQRGLCLKQYLHVVKSAADFRSKTPPGIFPISTHVQMTTQKQQPQVMLDNARVRDLLLLYIVVETDKRAGLEIGVPGM